MDEGKLREWRELSEEILSGMREWRLQHARATLTEIEAAIDERLWQLRARMLEDVAMASSAVRGEGSEAAMCPDCGQPLRMQKTRRPRRLQTQGGREIVLERSYGVCAACGAGFFPSG